MKKRWKQIAALALTGMMLFPVNVSASDSELETMIQETASGIRTMDGISETYLLNDKEWMPAGTAVCDWTAMALAFAGEEEAYDSYLERLESYVSEDGTLENGLATEYHRIALTVLALGGDPTAFGGKNLIAEGIYHYNGDLGSQGSNGYIYALLALDANSYEVPEEAVYTRESLLGNILDAQAPDGGFAMVGNSSSDIDITAMALQALAAYQDEAEVQEAIEPALEWLSAQMSPYGTFVNGYGEETCESSAQVLMALGALGIDPEEDARFIKGDVNPLAGMKQFRLEDGTYMHKIEDEEANLMASEQALLAMESIILAKNGAGRLLDLTTYTAPESVSSGGIGIIAGIGAAAVIIVIIAVVVVKKKKTTGKE